MTDGSTAFNYTDEGIIISSNSSYKEGFGTVNGELKYGVIGQEKFEDFVSGYPVLIKAGAAVPITIASEINYKARRTILAYNKENIFIVAIESPGMNFSQMQSFLRTLKVDYAINLDGGGSTKILRDGKCITKALANRPVDNIMAVYLKPKVIYRV
nr:MAG TPA: Phosphodiester glycosidase [Caudoviricetes sp.]